MNFSGISVIKIGKTFRKTLNKRIQTIFFLTGYFIFSVAYNYWLMWNNNEPFHWADKMSITEEMDNYIMINNNSIIRYNFAAQILLKICLNRNYSVLVKKKTFQIQRNSNVLIVESFF